MYELSLYKLYFIMFLKLDLRNDNVFMVLCIYVYLFKVLFYVVFLYKFY